jgi:UDP-glucose 4-epimerase
VILITGVAGFVGCNLAASLLARGRMVAGLDNLSLGTERNIESIRKDRNFVFEVVDLADLESYRHALRALHARRRIAEVWHLAASSDIPAGVADPRVDLRDTFMTTFNTLLLMKELEIDTIAFSSSSAVYGDQGERELAEDTGPLFPISNYGAMKLASEASISASLESFLKQAFVFRFPNVVGVPATHGVILDFIRKLKATPGSLAVLGDGTQRKSYLHVDELVEAMLFIRDNCRDPLGYFNIGANDEGVTVRSIAETVVQRVAPGARISYGQGDRGWVGDVPRFRFSVAKLSSLGWQPRLGSADAVRKAVEQVAMQERAA